jgi:chromate transport protein ChrA
MFKARYVYTYNQLNNFVSFLDCQQLQVFKWVSGIKTLIKLCAFTIIYMFHKQESSITFWETIFFLIILFFLIQNPFVIPYIVLINGVETYTSETI